MSPLNEMDARRYLHETAESLMKSLRNRPTVENKIKLAKAITEVIDTAAYQQRLKIEAERIRYE